MCYFNVPLNVNMVHVTNKLYWPKIPSVRKKACPNL